LKDLLSISLRFIRSEILWRRAGLSWLASRPHSQRTLAIEGVSYATRDTFRRTADCRSDVGVDCLGRDRARREQIHVDPATLILAPTRSVGVFQNGADTPNSTTEPSEREPEASL
jgi:hypothetical protein